MEDTIWWKIGDAYMPEPIRSELYKPIYKSHPIEINGWSFLHLLSGVIFALLFPQYTILFWIFIHTVWELYQITIGMTPIMHDPVVESTDIAFDTIFAVIGFFAASLMI